MARTLTPAPTDRSMWRRLLRLVHPDGGGDEALFVWVNALREYVAGDTPEPPVYHIPRRTTSQYGTPTVPFDPGASFADLTRRALELIDGVDEPYSWLLSLLADCYEVSEVGGEVYRWQQQGATYKSLAAIGHKAGMDKASRSAWYRVCESIPMSQRHAKHILSKLQDRAA